MREKMRRLIKMRLIPTPSESGLFTVPPNITYHPPRNNTALKNQMMVHTIPRITFAQSRKQKKLKHASLPLLSKNVVVREVLKNCMNCSALFPEYKSSVMSESAKSLPKE